MYKNSFDLHKVERLLSKYGNKFVFNQPVIDDFGEPTAEFKEVDVTGVYHESQGYISKSVGDGTTSRSKPTSQILTLFPNGKTLSIGDTTKFNGKSYKVTGIKNVGNIDIAFDVSLEVVDDGNGF